MNHRGSSNSLDAGLFDCSWLGFTGCGSVGLLAVLGFYLLGLNVLGWHVFDFDLGSFARVHLGCARLRPGSAIGTGRSAGITGSTGRG
jgi:hypothetical protein